MRSYGAPRHQGEASARANGPVAEEQFAPVGGLTAHPHVGVVDAETGQLVHRDPAQVEPRPVPDVGVERVGHVDESLGDVGSDLVALGRDRRTDEGVDRARVVEGRQRGAHDAPAQSSPSGVDDRESR
jgi:hypothetical protein